MEHGRWMDRIGLSGISMILLLLLHIPEFCSGDGSMQIMDTPRIATDQDRLSDKADDFEGAKEGPEYDVRKAIKYKQGY